MNRLTALDEARAQWGPTAYAEYLWRGVAGEPLCAVSYGTGATRREAVADNFNDAIESLLLRQRAKHQRLVNTVAKWKHR